MTKGRKALLVAAVCVSVTACQTGGISTGQAVGGAAGAAAGGLIGTQIGSGTGRVLATLGGVLIGGLIGSEIGRYLDQQDQQMNQQAAVEAHSTGATRTWTNPESGNSGTIRQVQPAASASSGASCSIQESRVVLADGTTDSTRYRLCEQNGQYYTEAI